MLLTLTLSLAAFTSSMALTLDGHLHDQVYYQLGADLNLAELGESTEQTEERTLLGQPVVSQEKAEKDAPSWLFLPVSEHLRVEGVQAAARVGDYHVTANIGGRTQAGRLLGVDRTDFPVVAFFRPDFATGEPLGGLMNRLAVDPAGILVSHDFMARNGLNVGDALRLTVNAEGKNHEILFTIAGPLRLFPTLYPQDGPFFVANLELVRKIDSESGQVNIFRTAFRDIANNEDWSYDFWIDAKTREMVEVHVPGADIYDPENDPTMDNSPENAWSTSKPISSIEHDISFNMELDDSLFQLQPPEGYTVINIAREQVTEKEIVDYLGILADYYDKTFPERLSPVAVTSDKLNAIGAKPKNNRTAAEQKLLETHNYYKMANLNMLPIGHFIKDHTVENSFRYIGKGVNLGDQDRIVCWYKLKDSNTYRAVYGDLSVKDIRADELPIGY